MGRHKKVTILLTQRLSMFELACALELFALPRTEFKNWYDVKVLSLTRSDYDNLGNTMFACERVQRLPKSDLLIVPSYGVKQSDLSARDVEEVMKHDSKGGRTVSFCSGSFLLAEAGLLENRTATTHWRYAAQFRERFPHLEFKTDILYEYDGVVGCSAGSAAGIDLGIEVIRQDYGHKAANNVARRLVLPAHRNGGQSQFIEKPMSYEPSAISKSMDWAVQNLTHKLRIDDIASQANMTRRTFDRHFKKLYNTTPADWLAQRKIEIARELLEEERYSMEKVAVMSGYENAITFRQNFKKHLSISPSEYREKFSKVG